ncbi:hypothetical protein EG68_07473 [Paragonimus skrjabini miyazakii]|uniref:Uncharacterized protein n=1 Tax=Paragonimus skrjabini miyazakii TaxID=59628 RepID=A0A8S9YS49_9TREM|nr:hypothetical protein EG68_07473 [Paragonimus skrjabini miyazakii]
MPGTSGPNKSEDSEGPSFSGKLLNSIIALLSLVIEGGHIKTQSTPTPPAPEKFRVGDNFSRWEFQAKKYVFLFTQAERARVLATLLDGEALDIAIEEGILQCDIIDGTFRRLRACFTTGPHRLEVCRQFHGRIQHPGEKLAAFIRELRRLCAGGFTDDTPEVREQHIPQHAVEGIKNPNTCRALLTAAPTSIQEALDRADATEVGRPVVAANGTDIKSVGWLNVPITLGEKVREHPMLVVDNLPWDAILEIDFLTTLQGRVNIPIGTSECNTGTIPFCNSARQSMGVMATAVKHLLSSEPCLLLAPLMPVSESTLTEFQDVFAWKEAYRATVCASTGQTPHFMVSGRELRLVSDTLLPTDHHEPLLTTKYIHQMQSSLVRGHQLARSHPQAAQRHQKAYFDGRVHGAQYQPGDEVWLYDAVPPPGILSKLHKHWKGSYIIDEVLTHVTYRIKQPAIPGWSSVVQFN